MLRNGCQLVSWAHEIAAQLPLHTSLPEWDSDPHLCQNDKLLLCRSLQGCMYVVSLVELIFKYHWYKCHFSVTSSCIQVYSKLMYAWPWYLGTEEGMVNLEREDEGRPEGLLRWQFPWGLKGEQQFASTGVRVGWRTFWAEGTIFAGHRSEKKPGLFKEHRDGVQTLLHDCV